MKSLPAIVFAIGTLLVAAQSGGVVRATERLPRLKISENHRFLVTEVGNPFFWLGDTAWWIRGIRPAEVDRYLAHRARHGFNVVQLHCGYDGSAAHPAADYAGNTPFLDKDPFRPNERFWRSIDSIVEKAAAHGLYVALAPMWGGEYGRAFGTDAEKAHRFGQWIGARYARHSHVLWIVSGEYSEINHFKHPVSKEQKSVFNAAARGLRAAHSGAQLMTIHPGGGRSSSEDFHGQEWLDFNMLQSGHFIDSKAYATSENHELVSADYVRQTVKPVLDGEPIYEDTPDAVWKVKHVNGPRADANAMRRKAYWSVFAGAFGHTYGHNDVYGFFEPKFPGEMLTLKTKPSGPGQQGNWRAALDAPGALHMKHLRHLMESRPFLTRIPDRSLLADDAGSGLDYAAATRDARGSYAMVYIPRARRVNVRLGKINGAKISAWWFDPRNGEAAKIGTFDRSREREFAPPAEGDWVLILDGVSGISVPGRK